MHPTDDSDTYTNDHEYTANDVPHVEFTGKVSPNNAHLYGTAKVNVKYQHLLNLPEAPGKIARHAIPPGTKIDRSVTVRFSNGTPAATHHRVESAKGKELWWEPKGIEATALPLYGCHWLIEDKTPPRARVFLVEGEHKAEVLHDNGFPAVSLMAGASGMMADESLDALLPYSVILWPDTDFNGASQECMEKHGRRIVERGGRVEGTIQWEKYQRGDVYDLWLKCGEEPVKFVNDLHWLIDTMTPWQVVPFPAPLPATSPAYYGPIGDIANQLADDTEASREAVLIQLIAALGCLFGRNWYITHDGAHHARVFGVLIGDTATSRKGTSLNKVREFIKRCDPDFIRKAEWAGFGSGEGFRMPSQSASAASSAKIKQTINPTTGKPSTEITIHQEDRLFAVVPEFGGQLAAAQRLGSTISAEVRNAWDGIPPNTRKAESHRQEMAYHVSMIGHITPEEIEDRLDEQYIYNGFANRFMWFAVDRQGIVLRPPYIQDVLDTTPLRTHVKHIQETQAYIDDHPRALKLSISAYKLWDELYVQYADTIDVNRVIKYFKARATSHILRIALVYAMIDRATQIQPAHLRAADALWQYHERSVEHVFTTLRMKRNGKYINVVKPNTTPHPPPLPSSTTSEPLRDVDRLTRIIERHGPVNRRRLFNLIPKGWDGERLNTTIDAAKQENLIIEEVEHVQHTNGTTTERTTFRSSVSEGAGANHHQAHT